MKQSEIWLVDLEPTTGAEIRKVRPAIILSNDKLGTLPLKVIIPITDWKNNFILVPWMVKIDPSPSNGLTREVRKNK